MSRNTALGPRNLSVVDSLAPVSRAVLSAVNSASGGHCTMCKHSALYEVKSQCSASTVPSAECKQAPVVQNQ